MKNLNSSKKMSSRDDFVAYTGNDFQDLAGSVTSLDLRTSSESKSGSSSLADIKRKHHKHHGSSEIFEGSSFSDIEKVDIEDLNKKLKHLKENADHKIRNLSGSLKSDFESLAQYVSWMYNTEGYDAFYKEIVKHFGDRHDYQPGTIGAYCGGCLDVKSKGISRGCNVVCAGSIPPPYEDPNFEFCEYLVIWAVHNGKSFDFTTLNEVEVKSARYAIVFVENKTIEDFPGFTDAEKKILEQNGIEEVRLIYYNSDCNTEDKYVNLTQKFAVLNELKARHANAVAASSSSGSMNWFWLLIIAIIILMVILFIFRGKY